VPALWIARSLTLPPLAVLACAGSVYAAAYAVLFAGLATAAQTTPVALSLRRLVAWTPPQS